MSASFRPASAHDTSAVASLAANNGLLTGGLDERGFSLLLEWLHDKQGPGRRLQVVGESEGQIVAHYGAMPIKAEIQGRPVLMGLASNLVIAESARKSVSFFALQNFFHKQYQACSYDLLCGCITRKGVLEPHLRAGWKRLGSLPVLIRPLRLRAIAKKMVPNRLFGVISAPLCAVAQACLDLLCRPETSLTLDLHELREFLPEHAAFLQGWQRSNEISSCRDPETLNWRFFSFPERGYRVFGAFREGSLCGYVAIREMDLKQFHAVAIVDIVANNGDREVLASLMRHVLTEGKSSGVDLIATVVQPDSWIAERFRRWGFLKSPEQFEFVVHQPKGSTLALSEESFAKWYLTWFEHDYV